MLRRSAVGAAWSIPVTLLGMGWAALDAGANDYSLVWIALGLALFVVTPMVFLWFLVANLILWRRQG